MSDASAVSRAVSLMQTLDEDTAELIQLWQAMSPEYRKEILFAARGFLRVRTD